MSVEIAKSFNFNSDLNEVRCNLASSNLRPRHFERCIIKQNDERLEDSSTLTKNEQFIFMIIRDIRSGSIRLEKTVNTRMRYAILEVKRREFETLNKVGLETCYQLDKGDVMHQEVIKEVVDIFINAWHKKDKKIKAVLKDGRDRYISKDAKNKVTITPHKEIAKKYTTQKEIELSQESIHIGTTIEYI